MPSSQIIGATTGSTVARWGTVDPATGAFTTGTRGTPVSNCGFFIGTASPDYEGAATLGLPENDAGIAAQARKIAAILDMTVFIDDAGNSPPSPAGRMPRPMVKTGMRMRGPSATAAARSP